MAASSTTASEGTASIPTCSSVTPSCVDFEGCAAALRHCAHDDPIYNNSGWPCFAYDQMHEFFETHRAR